MNVVYHTKQGDVLDAIVWKHYNGQTGALEQVLVANKGLASHGAVLPAGVLVELPEIQRVEVKDTVRLW